MPISAERKLNVPPALLRCSAVASIAMPMAGLSADGALCIALADFSTCSTRVAVVPRSFSSWSIRCNAFCSCCSMPLTSDRNDSSSES